jgi:hypothetical protein
MSLVLQARRSQPFPHFTIVPPKHNDAGIFDLLIDEQFGEAALHAVGDRARVDLCHLSVCRALVDSAHGNPGVRRRGGIAARINHIGFAGSLVNVELARIDNEAVVDAALPAHAYKDLELKQDDRVFIRLRNTRSFDENLSI